MAFNSGFVHETRIVSEPRMLDGHEQLVIGADHVWYGDSMRREPDKRDAYSAFSPCDAVAGGRALATFARIWAQAAPVYVHSGLVAAIASTEPLKPEAPIEPTATIHPTPAALPPGAAETLDAWQPSTRH